MKERIKTETDKPKLTAECFYFKYLFVFTGNCISTD